MVLQFYTKAYDIPIDVLFSSLVHGFRTGAPKAAESIMMVLEMVRRSELRGDVRGRTQGAAAELERQGEVFGIPQETILD